MGILFNVLSLFYAFRGLQVAAIIVRDWAKLRGPNFTSQAKGLAGQAAFFLAVPIGVFFHELAHAIFVLVFDGQIIEFGYRIFWGFVEHSGNYTAAQIWFIALAGTLGSLLFGLLLWLALRQNNSPTFRYFGLQAFRYQIIFSLIYYPVFTILTLVGDWETIYNFNATPILSGATAVFHAGSLLLFWRTDRGGFFEMGAYGSAAAGEKIMALEQQAAASPMDTALQLKLIRAYQSGGMTNKAKQAAQQFLEENPNSAEGHLQLALIEGMGKREVPAKAKNEAERALSLGLKGAAVSATAHLMIGRHHLGVNKLQEAVDRFSQAIGGLNRTDSPDIYISLLYHRALAYRRKEQYDAAFQDIQQAIEIARSGNQTENLSFLNQELETIINHSGRSPEQFKTPTNYP